MMVMITCLITGEAVPTGVRMDAETFKSSDMSANKTQCTSCNFVHSWDKAEAYLDS